MKSYLIIASITFSLLSSPLIGIAECKKITVKGKTESPDYSVIFVPGKKSSAKARVQIKKVNANSGFTFKIAKKDLIGAALAVLDGEGRSTPGPVMLNRSKSKQKAYQAFKGTTPEKSCVLNIKTIDQKEGYGLASLPKKYVLTNKLAAITDSEGNPIGAASGGLEVSSAALSSKGVKIQADEEGLGTVAADSDSDGIIDALDPDEDGDGISNITDEDFKGNDNATFSSIVADLNNTLNVNIGSVTQEDIDSVIGGENLFSVGFWFSLSEESNITGGHVVCSDANPYCNNSTGVAIYGGLTESDQNLTGDLWTTLNMDGSGRPNLEFLSVSGGNAIAGAFQPRVGTNDIKPGDAYLVNYTGAAGNAISTKLLLLSPYMVTAPALKSFTANSVENQIDYTQRSSTFGNNGNPIVTDGSGVVTFEFYRPQRQLYQSETPLSDTDNFRDFGHLKYGVIFEGVSSQFTCGGLYSSVSSALVEDTTPLGTGDSPRADQGANLVSLVDQAGDAVPDSSNTYSLTVDLRTCLTRASQPVGLYRVRLLAQGEDLSGGANSSSTMFWVDVQ